MNEKQNMFKEGDWVHTQDGIGMITKVFPHYYQYWEKAKDDKYRKETYGDNEKLAVRLLGERKETGDWVKDIIYVKRLCDHDLNPMSRTMCFHTKAYANDGITKKEMKKVREILKEPKIARRFQNYKCKYRQMRHTWKVLIPVETAVAIRKALDELENNDAGNLRMTMRDIEAYFKKAFDVDLFESQKSDFFNNATIHTLSLPEDDPDHYNRNREKMFCKIMISRRCYDTDYLSNLIVNQRLDPVYYEQDAWDKAGWDGVETGY